jgi:hypothetical protein
MSRKRSIPRFDREEVCQGIDRRCAMQKIADHSWRPKHETLIDEMRVGSRGCIRVARSRYQPGARPFQLDFLVESLQDRVRSS